MSLKDYLYLKENEEKETEIIQKIKEFFKTESSPTDDDIHTFSEELGINPHKLETYIYKILWEFLNKETD